MTRPIEVRDRKEKSAQTIGYIQGGDITDGLLNKCGRNVTKDKPLLRGDVTDGAQRQRALYGRKSTRKGIMV